MHHPVHNISQSSASGEIGRFKSYWQLSSNNSLAVMGQGPMTGDGIHSIKHPMS
jgi:hypothetical protein